MFVGVDQVRKGPLTRTEPVIGRIVATRKGVVAALVSGAVVSIDVAVGQHVKKGRILARQDIRTAEARLAFETAELKLAERELERFEALRSNKSAAFARSRYDLAVHRLARARANVRLARLAIEKAVVTAPYDGVVVRKATELGAYLKDGSAVVELVNDTEVEIEADVPADRLSGLRPGRVVSFSARAGGVPLRARVRALLPMQNALTRTQAVRFKPLGNSPAVHYSINQAVTVDVPIGATRTVVSVHKDAIVNRGATRLVFLVKGGRAVPRPVGLGEAIGSRFVVRAGLAPGDIAVVRGNERLRPGQPVRHRPLLGAAAQRRTGDSDTPERKPAH
ncbi:MAG: efflux RND transporter periplasmic adaptor subunit [Rhodospirillaceae bacterium]|nr:efflux RND transporter periplasmic adaptor subunit [Rhodospirillaceae bacterium]MYK57387.1 efflux RND transporter periplasmic adaptor subunit [Rhodospirillaceae bacterium]